MKKIIACVLIIFTISTIFIVKTYSKETNLDKFVLESKVLNSEMLSKKLVRFHVIANSDAEVDQNVKLQVKDAVLEDMVPKLNESESRDETIEIINNNTQNIKKIAEETLKKNHMSNDVSVVLNTTFFPTKYYNDFSLPAGDYLALRVIIGNGEGKNWWCVLFPPLCLVDVQTEEIEEEELKEEEESKELDSKQKKQSIVSEEDQLKEDLIPKAVVKIEEELQGEQNPAKEEERPQIRWKALELLGFYKDSQAQ